MRRTFLYGTPGLVALVAMACHDLDVDLSEPGRYPAYTSTGTSTGSSSSSSSSGTGGACAGDHSNSGGSGGVTDLNLGGMSNQLGSGGFGGISGHGGADQKSDSIIRQLINAPIGQLAAEAERHALKFRNCTEVVTTIQCDPANVTSVSQYVATLGGQVTNIWGSAGRLQAWVPVGQLDALRNHSNVWMVRYPNFGSDDALNTTQAASWHSAGETGANARIGIIDSGFGSITNVFGSPLPAEVTGQSFVAGEPFDPATSNHGSAVAGVANIMAPDAEFFLARAVTPEETENAVGWLRSQNVDVINMSRSFYGESPGDGTGGFADFVTAARNDGILWVNSAGNARQRHIATDFVDANNNTAVEFNGAERLFIGAAPGSFRARNEGELVIADLRWSDWGMPTTDFRLVLQQRQLGIVGGSEVPITPWTTVETADDPQTGMVGQRPTERIRFVSDARAIYALVVFRPNVPPATLAGIHLDLFTDLVPLQNPVEGRSVTHPSDLPEVLSVGAVELAAPHAIVPQSGEGPTLGPGGVEAGGAMKPDISAISNVPVPGFNGTFAGTSAAAPHVAGAVALMRSTDATLTPAQIEQRLFERAIDQGPVGADNRFGAGRMVLGVPLTGLNLSGPTVATLGGVYDFTALSTPGNASGPIDYAWTATSNNPFSFSGGASSTATFSWDSVGLKTVSVTANGSLLEWAPLAASLNVDVQQLGMVIDVDTSDCAPEPGVQRTIEFHFTGASAASEYVVYFMKPVSTWYAMQHVYAGQNGSFVVSECGGGPGRNYSSPTFYFAAGLADDPDGDGLDSSFEGWQTNTDPLQADTGGQGTPDGDRDPDGDGLTNLQERNRIGSATFDACRHGASHPQKADSDGDGVNDNLDKFPSDPAAWRDDDCNGKSDDPLNGTSISYPPIEVDP